MGFRLTRPRLPPAGPERRRPVAVTWPPPYHSRPHCHPPSWQASNSGRLLRQAFAGLLLCLVCIACGNGSEAKSGAQSETAQSMAAYDLATDLWLRRNQPRKALEQALKAIELDDENADAQHLIALLYLDFCRRDEQECRLEQAEHHVRIALEERQDFRAARNTLGVVLIHRKHYREAISVLKPLTQDILYQTPENAWGNLGWAYLEDGQLEPAIEALLRSTAVQPDFCVGHYRLGLAYSRKKDPQAALQAYTRALGVEDDRCKAMQVVYPARAEVLLQLGRQDEAISDLEECVHLGKNTDTGRGCNASLASLK